MNRYYVPVIMMLIIFLTSCISSNPIDSNELEKYEVNQPSNETSQDDFIFRLVSEKEEYKEGKKVQLYGEIEYIGEREEVTIHHSSSAIRFNIEEKIRNYEIGGVVNDIGLSTTLKKGEPYREHYVKSGGYSLDQDPEDYVNFMKDFFYRDDFPFGYYIVSGFAVFFIEDGEERESFIIEAKVDFKVVE